jgi:hypothetical protein
MKSTCGQRRRRRRNVWAGAPHHPPAHPSKSFRDFCVSALRWCSSNLRISYRVLCGIYEGSGNPSQFGSAPQQSSQSPRGLGFAPPCDRCCHRSAALGLSSHSLTVAAGVRVQRLEQVVLDEGSPETVVITVMELLEHGASDAALRTGTSPVTTL